MIKICVGGQRRNFVYSLRVLPWYTPTYANFWLEPITDPEKILPEGLITDMTSDLIWIEWFIDNIIDNFFYLW